VDTVLGRLIAEKESRVQLPCANQRTGSMRESHFSPKKREVRPPIDPTSCQIFTTHIALQLRGVGDKTLQPAEHALPAFAVSLGLFEIPREPFLCDS